MSTVRDQIAADRLSYDEWKANEQRRWEDAGNKFWFADRATARGRNRGKVPPRDAFTGPLWVALPWFTGEALTWFTVDQNPRYTFTDWQDMKRVERANYTAELVEAANGAALATLAYWRDLTDRRGETISAARAGGASWAQIMAATGLSRMACYSLLRDYSYPVETLALDAEADAVARTHGYVDAADMAENETAF